MECNKWGNRNDYKFHETLKSVLRVTVTVNGYNELIQIPKKKRIFLLKYVFFTLIVFLISSIIHAFFLL